MRGDSVLLGLQTGVKWDDWDYYRAKVSDHDAYVNDLEQPAFDALPELKRLKDELKSIEGFDHVMMSGSGTSIFCIGEPKDKDAFMKEFGQRKGINVFPAEFTSRKQGTWFQKPFN
eukprot:CAMPEP_0176500614 /NCGR_PEP_ID=MMETSP0200_2-20121128/13667_1 /TAXON_ID=947934 /ORGANISM="Chaetoceros sp., Strain GSL56" /LENGTH=115 /DNA_ID=CAMNT_0017899337 /DNA_START=1207 /DNA_END=1553 /DNA_ORIENTATION=-